MGAVMVSLTWNRFNGTMDWDVRPTSYDWPKADFEIVQGGGQNALWLVSEDVPDKIMDAKHKLAQAWQGLARSISERLAEMEKATSGIVMVALMRVSWEKADYEWRICPINMDEHMAEGRERPMHAVFDGCWMICRDTPEEIARVKKRLVVHLAAITERARGGLDMLSRELEDERQNGKRGADEA